MLLMAERLSVLLIALLRQLACEGRPSSQLSRLPPGRHRRPTVLPPETAGKPAVLAICVPGGAGSILTASTTATTARSPLVGLRVARSRRRLAGARAAGAARARRSGRCELQEIPRCRRGLRVIRTALSIARRRRRRGTAVRPLAPPHRAPASQRASGGEIVRWHDLRQEASQLLRGLRHEPRLLRGVPRQLGRKHAGMVPPSCQRGTLSTRQRLQQVAQCLHLRARHEAGRQGRP